MIAVAAIVPTAYLGKLKPKANIHLVLAHQVMDDAQYAAYYRRQTDAYVILDNSAFELGEAVSAESILRTAGIVKPDEVVLPDVLYDAENTLRRVQAFLREHKQAFAKGTRFMAVPHGKSIEEYVDCYAQLARIPGVHTLGIGTIYNRAFPGGRKAIFQALEDRGVLSVKPHHLLGLGDSGHMELQALKGYSAIRSCDSSAAYMLALQGRQIHPGHPYKKIRDRISFTDPYRTDIAALTEANMRVLQEASR